MGEVYRAQDTKLNRQVAIKVRPEAQAVAALAWTMKLAPARTITRFSIPLPEGQQFSNIGRQVVALSPDGTNLVYASTWLPTLNGEPEAARLLLRDLVNATVGFEALAAMTDKPAKSLPRMLSRSGNPSMDNLAAIFDAVRQRLKVGLKAQMVKAA